MNKKVDYENKFVSIFNPDTGFYMRTSEIENEESFKEIVNSKNPLEFMKLADKYESGKDPFMASFPELLDIGIMETCVCAYKCNVDCYQKAISRTGKNMSLDNFEKIIKQCDGKMFQAALGGSGDVDTHESFEEILALCRKYHVVPNFTTSGIAMTKEKAEICKKYCGAIAVSEHFADYTERALDLLLEAGVKTNIHYVLSNKSIDIAIDRLRQNSFKKGINAIVFLLYKPVGLGREENMLLASDPRVKEFFSLIDHGTFHHKIGFDSCSCAGLVNFTKDVNLNSVDYCEGGRFSAYIDANMHMMPCSFANQDPTWFVDLNTHTIDEAWNSDIFHQFRYSLSHSCPDCPNRDCCAGGCPLVNQITLCNRKERLFMRGKYE